MVDKKLIPPTPPRKFYTAFVMYCQDSITHETLQLHCTHKYLGVQNDNAMAAVGRIISKHLKEDDTVWPLAVFNERAMFGAGPDGIVSVLKSFIKSDAFFPHLREELEQFRPDDYLEYIPHITLDKYPSINGQFQCYAIMHGERIIMYWRNPKWDREEKQAQTRAKILEDLHAPETRSGVKMPNHLKLMD